MRVRTIELRILALALAGLWLAAAGLVLFGYRPGGPVDMLVGLALVGPALVALAALAWPPVTRGDRAFAVMAWLALAAVLLLLPSIAGLVAQLVGRGPQTLLPSLEAAYPWLLALTATGLFAGLGIARRRLGAGVPRRRLITLGTIVGLALALVTGTAFSVLAIANEIALADRPAISSRFGPTDPALEPPECDGRLDAGATALLDLRLDLTVDNRRTGQLVIDGVRDGSDVSWTGFASSPVLVGQVGAARIGDLAWLRMPRQGWTETDLAAADNQDLDVPLVDVALTSDNRSVAEDHGLAYIEGARARHCRVTIDGATLRRALPEMSLLLGQADISRWRVDLDYWVFADGELGQVDGRASGPAGGVMADALLATLRFRLTAIDRDSPIAVVPPTP